VTTLGAGIIYPVSAHISFSIFSLLLSFAVPQGPTAYQIPWKSLRLEAKAFARGGGGEIFRGTYMGHVIAAKHNFESSDPSEKQDTEEFDREVRCCLTDAHGGEGNRASWFAWRGRGFVWKSGGLVWCGGMWSSVAPALPPTIANPSWMQKQISDQVAMLTKLVHPCILSLYGVSTGPDGSMCVAIKHSNSNTTCITWSSAAKLFVVACMTTALTRAHDLRWLGTW